MTTIINGSSNINLDFSTAGRITGDFSNATHANRVLFQSTTTNGNTSVGAVPNGSAINSNFVAYGAPDPTNAPFAQLVMTGVEGQLRVDKLGSGSYLPMTFYTGGSETLRLSETSKAVILSGGSTSANGTGITFPATQSSSSDANTLDDYEEGSWTPSIAGRTFNSALGTYVKVGRVCTVVFIMNTLSAAVSGNIQIDGLPFAGLTGGALYGANSIPFTEVGGISFGTLTGGTAFLMYGRINEGTTSIQLLQTNGQIHDSFTAGGGIQTNGTVRGSFSYITSA